MAMRANREESSPIPPLRNGDRRSLAEFLRLRAMHPEIHKAELINGLVAIEEGCDGYHGTFDPSRPRLRGVHPLYNGDRLDVEEFERIWALHPEIKKAELINGEVYLEMTVGDFHSVAHAIVMLWLGTYWSKHIPQMQFHDNATFRLLDTHDVQPDAALRYRDGTVRKVGNCCSARLSWQ